MPVITGGALKNTCVSVQTAVSMVAKISLQTILISWLNPAFGGKIDQPEYDHRGQTLRNRFDRTVRDPVVQVT